MVLKIKHCIVYYCVSIKKLVFVLCTGSSYPAGAVQVFLVLGELVKGQEGVAVAGGAVADAVAFSEQAPVPDHLRTFCSLLQVLLLFKHLGRQQPLLIRRGEVWVDELDALALKIHNRCQHSEYS